MAELQNFEERWAARLLDAGRTATALAPITETELGLDDEQGYAIQAAALALRLERGEKLRGYKIELPALSFGADPVPIYGAVTDAMIQQPDTAIELDRLIAPTVRAAIVFLLAEDVPAGATVPDVIAATNFVCAGMEIADARIRGPHARLADTIADGASAGRVIVGGRCLPPHKVDLALLGCLIEQRGSLVATAAGAAALGHPAASVAWLANALASRGHTLRRGSLVFSGNLATSGPIFAGDHITVSFAHLGSVSAFTRTR